MNNNENYIIALKISFSLESFHRLVDGDLQENALVQLWHKTYIG